MNGLRTVSLVLALVLSLGGNTLARAQGYFRPGSVPVPGLSSLCGVHSSQRLHFEVVSRIDIHDVPMLVISLGLGFVHNGALRMRSESVRSLLLLGRDRKRFCLLMECHPQPIEILSRLSAAATAGVADHTTEILEPLIHRSLEPRQIYDLILLGWLRGPRITQLVGDDDRS